MKRLVKGKDKKISGVCSGFANYWNIDVTLVRIGLIVLGLFLPITVILLYLILILIIPDY